MDESDVEVTNMRILRQDTGGWSRECGKHWKCSQGLKFEIIECLVTIGLVCQIQVKVIEKLCSKWLLNLWQGQLFLKRAVIMTYPFRKYSWSGENKVVRALSKLMEKALCEQLPPPYVAAWKNKYSFLYSFCSAETGKSCQQLVDLSTEQRLWGTERFVYRGGCISGIEVVEEGIFMWIWKIRLSFSIIKHLWRQSVFEMSSV